MPCSCTPIIISLLVNIKRFFEGGFLKLNIYQEKPPYREGNRKLFRYEPQQWQVLEYSILRTHKQPYLAQRIADDTAYPCQ